MEKTFYIDFEDFEKLNNILPHIIDFAGNLRTITFQGDLGAGKTTLIHALSKHLGVESNISSPTFTFVNEYRLPSGEPVFHMDMYRIEKEEDAYSIGLETYFEQNYWCFIEWPERIISFLPDCFVSLMIETDPTSHRRTIRMRYGGSD